MPYFGLNGFGKQERRILGAMIFIVIGLCVIVFISNRNSKRIAASTEDIRRSEEIKYDIEQIVSVSTDLETGARGYVITGNEHYLEPTNKAIGTVFEHIDHLKTQAANAPNQLNRIKELETLVDQKISYSTRAIELRRNKGLDTAMNFITAGTEKQLMDKIRNITDIMLEEESMALNKKNIENEANFKDFNIAFNFLLATIAITLIAVFMVLRFYFRTRQKSEQGLVENKQLLQSIIDNDASVISVKDVAGRYMLINRPFENLHQVSREEIRGKTDYEIFSKETAEQIRKIDLDVITFKKPIQLEEDIPDNGQMHHYLSTKFPLFDNNRLLYAVCGNAIDITERKKLDEMDKQRSKEIFELFNNAPCGYLSTDKSGVVVEMNDTELKWLGYTREEVIGKMLTQGLLSKDSLAVFMYYFPKLRSGELKILHDIEVRFRRKDGSSFPALINTIAIYDSNGEFIKTRSSIFDLSLMKKAESELKQN